MLTKYEAALLARQNTADLVPAPQRTAGQNRIGMVMVALSLMSAIGLLYSAFFAERGQVARATQVAPASTMATPVIHLPTNGLPESALFLRNPAPAGEKAAPFSVVYR
jgi:hypothetical protein